ncbi:MAG TPA: carboxypeptidase-like regulatory domain-containing protein [Terriglobales bacterium]|nr:carboxypeptidase-like regulatory domain-containing protein [Terriglobales bacterium]
MPRAAAQEASAAINGVVTDTTGAAVSAAKITATDLDRGTVWPASTNEQGVYNLPRLPVGRYDIKVECQGFQSAQRSDIVLVLNQTARVDFGLKPGAISETVQVTEAPPLLQTETTELGTVIDSHEAEALPLISRNYIQLTLLTAGSVHTDPSTFKNGLTTANFSSGRPDINGNREQQNNFLLDGLDNNQMSDNLVGYTPAIDAVQEFNVMTQNAPAEFGNFMGGIISVTTKSGTNKFHGSAYEFLRNDALNANSWQNNLTSTPKAKLRWNEFGATFGGPIIRNKLFFFVDYQGERFDTPASTSAVTVMTAAERTGDFSQLCQTGFTGGVCNAPPAGSNALAVQLYNPYSVDAGGNRAPFANNQIPSNLFSSAANAIVNSKYYPLPINGNLTNNQFNTVSTQVIGDQGDLKLDLTPRNADHLSFRFSKSRLDNPSVNSLPLLYGQYNNSPTVSSVANWTHSFSPTFVNEARIGFNYVYNVVGAVNNAGTNLNQTFGIPGITDSVLAQQCLCGDGFAGAIGNPDVGNIFGDTMIQYEDTAVLTRSRHTLHLGFQGFRQRLDTYVSGAQGLAGQFVYDGKYTAGPSYNDASGPNPSTGLVGGLPEADFMLGLAGFVQVGAPKAVWGQRSNIFSVFAQDDWRVTRNLVVNYGLRYQVFTPFTEVDNRQTNYGLYTGVVQLAGQDGNSRALYNQYNGIGNYQPRIGIAWTPIDGTVVRSSFTISSYNEGGGNAGRLPVNPPFFAAHFENYEPNCTVSDCLPGSTLDQGLNPIRTTDPFVGARINLWATNLQPASSYQWSFAVEHQFGNSTTLQAAYIGQRATHEVVPLVLTQRVLNPDGTTSPSPYLAGNPSLVAEAGTAFDYTSSGSQEYEALQVTLQKRLSYGLQGQLAYTLSQCMTDSIGDYGDGGQGAPASSFWQNTYDPGAEWGPCFYDAKHILTGFLTYDLPFGRGRTYGNNMNAVEDAVVGGWQISLVPSFHTGFPLTIFAGDASGTGSWGARADCVAPPHVFGKKPAIVNGQFIGYQWFDPNSFATPAPGTFGSCGVGVIRGPGLATADLTLMKSFKLGETRALEFRAEATNFTNTPILNAPGVGVGPLLGIITQSQGERNIQFALRYQF